MEALKFFKVTSLPGTLVANAMYFVVNGSYSESYITTSAGSARSLGNSAMINALIDSKLAAQNTLEIAADITARNLLNTRDYNFLCLVIDATGDVTVASGSALYAFQNSDNTFIKVAEYESMDVVVAWANITGKPTSSPASIDDAVTVKHSHTNKTQLDLISEDVGWNMTYNGNPVQRFETTNW